MRSASIVNNPAPKKSRKKAKKKQLQPLEPPGQLPCLFGLFISSFYAHFYFYLALTIAGLLCVSLHTHSSLGVCDTRVCVMRRAGISGESCLFKSKRNQFRDSRFMHKANIKCSHEESLTSPIPPPLTRGFTHSRGWRWPEVVSVADAFTFEHIVDN